MFLTVSPSLKLVHVFELQWKWCSRIGNIDCFIPFSLLSTSIENPCLIVSFVEIRAFEPQRVTPKMCQFCFILILLSINHSFVGITGLSILIQLLKNSRSFEFLSIPRYKPISSGFEFHYHGDSILKTRFRVLFLLTHFY